MLLLNLYMPSAPGFQCQKHLHTKCSTSGVPWTYFWFNLRFLLNFPWVFLMKNHLPHFWNFCCQILFCEIIFVVAFAIPPKCTERRLHRRRRCTRRRWRRRRWSLDVVVVWSTEKCSRVRKKFLQLNWRENTFAKILIAQKLQNLRFLTKKSVTRWCT